MKKLYTIFAVLISFTLNAQTFTWTEQSSGTENHLNDVFFIDNQTGWAVGDNGVILTTTDGGETWNPQTSGTTDRFRTVFFLNDTTGWAASYNLGATLFKTTNGGTTWTDITPASMTGTIEDIEFANLMNGWMVADSIYKTVDGGTTWISQSISTSVSRTRYKALTVPTDSTAYVAGSSKRNTPSNNYADVFSTALNPTSAVDFMNGLGSLKTTDPDMRSIDYATPNIIFAGGTAGVIYRMEFEGQNNFGPWDINLDLSTTLGERIISSISFPTELNGMFLTTDGAALVYHTSDGGDNWNMGPDRISDLAPNALNATDANNAWVVGSSGKIYKGTRITTSVSNSKFGQEIRVYPNPVSDRVFVTLNNGQEEAEYRLFDISGRMLKQNELYIDGSTFSINVSDVKNGVYLLQVESGNESNTFRILKK